MKIWNYWKIFKFTQKPFLILKDGHLAHNEKMIDEIKVIVNKLHSETYNLLRKFKTQQYDTVFVMRKKKAFNTNYFTINYDIVICDHNGKILDALDNVAPGYISKHYPMAHSIYFSTIGTIKHYNLNIDDRLEIRRLKEWY